MIVLRTVLLADVLLLLALAGVLYTYMEHPAGVIAAALCCLTGGCALAAARWLDRQYERRR